MPFIKLDVGILESSLWAMDPERIIFITSLCMAKPKTFDQDVPTFNAVTGEPMGFTVPAGEYGFVESSMAGIVRRAHLEDCYVMGTKEEKEDVEGAFDMLQIPDSDSRSKSFDGRRLVRVDHGFIVLNYMEYRKKDHTNSERQRRFRSKKSNTGNGVTSLRNTIKPLRVTQAEAEAEALLSPNGDSPKPQASGEKRTMVADSEFWDSLQKDPDFAGVDFEEEKRKMRIWKKNPRNARREITRKFVLNWLSKADRNLSGLDFSGATTRDGKPVNGVISRLPQELQDKINNAKNGITTF